MAQFRPFVKRGKAMISVSLDIDQCAALDAIAAERRASRAQIVRESVDLFLRLNMPSQPMSIQHVSDTEVAS